MKIHDFLRIINPAILVLFEHAQTNIRKDKNWVIYATKEVKI